MYINQIKYQKKYIYCKNSFTHVIFKFFQIIRKKKFINVIEIK